MLKRRQTKIDSNGFYIFDEPKAYGKIFKRRKKYKPMEKKGVMYAMIDPQNRILAVFKTKAKGLQALKQREVKATMFGKPLSAYVLSKNNMDKVNSIPVGTILIQVPTIGSGFKIDNQRFEHEHRFLHFVDSKKCKTCPNAGNKKTENQTKQCHCSLIGFIRDSTPGWHYWSRHSIRMYKNKWNKDCEGLVRPDSDPWLTLY
jgi:hypothetical protein